MSAEAMTKPPVSGTTEFSVEGMTCGNCARHVTEAIQSVPGVRHAAVSLETSHASVRWQDGVTTDTAAVVRAVKQAGYEATPVEAHSDAHKHGAHWNLNLWLGGI